MAVTLVAFAEGVNTGAAYGAFARARESEGAAVRAHAYHAEAFASWPSVCALAANDFEQVVPALHAGVAAVLPALRAEARRLGDAGAPAIGMMSGSGATCFLLHAPGAAAEIRATEGARVVLTGTA